MLHTSCSGQCGSASYKKLLFRWKLFRRLCSIHDSVHLYILYFCFLVSRKFVLLSCDKLFIISLNSLFFLLHSWYIGIAYRRVLIISQWSKPLSFIVWMSIVSSTSLVSPLVKNVRLFYIICRYTAFYLLLFIATLLQYFITACSSPG